MLNYFPAAKADTHNTLFKKLHSNIPMCVADKLLKRIDFSNYPNIWRYISHT